MTKLIRPIISEKSAAKFARGEYLLAVYAGATKPEIKKEVKQLFNLDVLTVRTINLPAKKVKFRRRSGQRAARYRAIITLKKGQSFPGIDLPKDAKDASVTKEKDA